MTNIDELYTLEHHENGAEMQVKDENGNDLDMYLILAGTDSKRFREGFAKAKREALLDDETDTNVITLSEATIGWRGFMSKGKELEFSKEKVEQLYRNAPYIMTQVNFFIGNRANFTKS